MTAPKRYYAYAALIGVWCGLFVAISLWAAQG